MARKLRKISGAGRKKKARKAAASTGTKRAARKRADRKRKSKTAARGKTGTRRRRDAQPGIISGKITTALQAVVDAVADSDMLHGRTPPRLRPDGK